MILTTRQVICALILFFLFLGVMGWSIYRVETVRETQNMIFYSMGYMSRHSTSFTKGYTEGLIRGVRIGQRNFRFQDPERKHKTEYGL